MHISRDDIEKLKEGTLSVQAQQELLEHIEVCAECAESFAEMMEENLKTPSRGFSENVEYKIKETRRELFFYSLRVCAAVAASLAIVFTISFPNFFDNAERSREKLREKTENVLEEINNNFNGGILSHED